MAKNEQRVGPAEQHKNAILEAARDWVALGYSPVVLHGIGEEGRCTCGKDPCPHGAGKHPVLGGWTAHNHTLDEVEALLEENYWFNLGVRPGSGGGVCVDLDSQVARTKFEEWGGALDGTYIEATGRPGALHAFYATDVPTRKIEGVEFKGRTGYVVVAPSRHVSGRAYRVESGSLSALAPLPWEVLEIIAGSREGGESAWQNVAAEIDLGHPFPTEKFGELCASNAEFVKWWDDADYEDPSQRDSRLAFFALRAKWDLSEVAALLRSARDDGKQERVDYIARTIAEARAAVERGPRAKVSDEDVDKRFPLSDVAAVMREGPKPVEMLTPRLQRGVLHWEFGRHESGKTWFLLRDVADVLAAGGRVWFLDEEVNVNRLAQRLLALGVDDRLVAAGLHHSWLPGLGDGDKDKALFKRRIERERYEFVVFETATDFLVNFPAKENAGDEVTAWIQAYPQVAADLGCTVSVSDHVPKVEEDAGDPVAARAKSAKSKVMRRYVCAERFGRANLGVVEVEVRKNADDAPIGQTGDVFSYEIGGSGGEFVLRDMTDRQRQERKEEQAEKRKEWIREVVALVREHGPFASIKAMKEALSREGIPFAGKTFPADLEALSQNDAVPIWVSEADGKRPRQVKYMRTTTTRYEDDGP